MKDRMNSESRLEEIEVIIRSNPFQYYAYYRLSKYLPYQIKWLSVFLFGLIIFLPEVLILGFFGLIDISDPIFIQRTIAYTILLPTGMLFMVLIYSKFINTFSHLRKLAEVSNQEYQDFLNNNLKLFNHKIQKALWIVYAIGVFLANFLDYQYGQREFNQSNDVFFYNPIVILIVNTCWIILTSIVITLSWHLISIILVIWKYCEFPLHLRPLDPDGAAGLKPLANLSLLMSFICLLIIPALFIDVFVNQINPFENPYVATTLFLFLIMMIVVFFFPLIRAHTAMSDAKETIQHQLSEEHYSIYVHLREQIQSGSYSISGGTLSNLQGVTELYEKSEKMPIWPFDTSLIIKFITAIVIPFILIFGGQIIKSIDFSQGNERPYACAGDDKIVNTNQSVEFTNFSYFDSDGDVMLIQWNFNGDHIIDWVRDLSIEWPTNINELIIYQPRYSYTDPGTYVAVFIVTDNDGAKATDYCIVEVK